MCEEIKKYSMSLYHYGKLASDDNLYGAKGVAQELYKVYKV